MKRDAFSGAAWALALSVSAGVVPASGCLNPRPEELPSANVVVEPGADEGGGAAGSPIGPPPGETGVVTPSPSGPSFPDSEDGGGGVSDGGRDAEPADAGAPVGVSSDPSE